MSSGGSPQSAPSSTSAAPVGIRLNLAAAIVRQYGEQFRRPVWRNRPKPPPLL
jgi:hypothetical protein